MRGILPAVAAVFFTVAPLLAQQCPSYTKNRDTVSAFPLGAQSDLPDGFVVYRIANEKGLYRSGLKSYSPQLVPGTADMTPYNMTISDDGSWVLFVDSDASNMVIQRLDGTGRATYYEWDLKVCGFYRKSPHGAEVYWIEGGGRQARVMKAMQVDLTGTSAQFLTNTIREIVSFGWGERFFENEYVGAGSSVVGDQVLIREDGYYSYYGRTGFLTIPDSGRGTAGGSDFFAWANDMQDARWGCGHTMSHDGLHCLANVSLIGSACSAEPNGVQCQQWDGSVTGTACSPNRRAVIVRPDNWPNDTQHFDHKGFIITKFWHKGDAPVTIDAIVDSFGTSINWAPPSYRVGEFSEVDFTSWNFSNDPRIVIGALKGTSLETLGLPNALWVVNWLNNSWTRITPDSLTLAVDDPAMFITDLSGVRHDIRPPSSRAPLIRDRLRVAGVTSISPRSADRVWFSLGGRQVSSKAVSGVVVESSILRR